jgi:hypothetical protein
LSSARPIFLDTYLADLLSARWRSRDRFAMIIARTARGVPLAAKTDVANLMWPTFGLQGSSKSLKYLGFSDPGPAPNGQCDLNHIHGIEPV